MINRLSNQLNNRTRLFAAIAALLLLLAVPARAAEEVTTDSAFGLTNFAFASYLGSGFYTTANQRVFVFQVPLDYTIVEKTDTEAGWVLNLPVTFGLIDFSGLDLENIPDLNSIGTITFLPGIEYQYPVTPDWTLIPFADYGFARDLQNNRNVLVFGAGVKSYVTFNHRGNILTLGNKFLYARERTRSAVPDSDYSLLETGLDYRVKTLFTFGKRELTLSFYYINYFYPNNLVFLEQTKNPIRVGTENEIGFTISNLPDFLMFEKPRLGFGIRIGNGVTVYRFTWGLPF